MPIQELKKATIEDFINISTEKEILNSAIEDFTELLIKSYENKKIHIKDLKNIIILASEILNIEIAE